MIKHISQTFCLSVHLGLLIYLCGLNAKRLIEYFALKFGVVTSLTEILALSLQEGTSNPNVTYPDMSVGPSTSGSRGRDKSCISVWRCPPASTSSLRPSTGKQVQRKQSGLSWLPHVQSRDSLEALWPFPVDLIQGAKHIIVLTVSSKDLALYFSSESPTFRAL